METTQRAYQETEHERGAPAPATKKNAVTKPAKKAPVEAAPAPTKAPSDEAPAPQK